MALSPLVGESRREGAGKTGLAVDSLAVTDPRTSRARELRSASTDAERALWRALRAKQFEGLKFRRQQPIGPYFVDFVSFRAGLVVELDGGQHDLDSARARDAVRTAWLGGQGLRVLRFWNIDVLRNLEGVIEVIRGAISPPPPPSPSP